MGGAGTQPSPSSNGAEHCYFITIYCVGNEGLVEDKVHISITFFPHLKKFFFIRVRRSRLKAIPALNRVHPTRLDYWQGFKISYSAQGYLSSSWNRFSIGCDSRYYLILHHLSWRAMRRVLWVPVIVVSLVMQRLIILPRRGEGGGRQV